MSVASSTTPGIDWNSCSTPSIFTAVIAAPSMEDSSTRRSALPMVVPNPRSNGCAEEAAVLVGQRFGVGCQTLGLLKTSPKNHFLLFLSIPLRLAHALLANG